MQQIKLVDLTFANRQLVISLLLNETMKNREKYVAAENDLVNDILLWPLIMACSIVCRFPEAPFKQEYIVPQMLYQLCNADNSYHGVKYHSTRLDGLERNKLQSAMVNYALPAQDIRSAGYCPILANQLCLTEPITAEECRDMKIESFYGHTTNGLPIISDKCDNFKNDETVLALDRMTMYFEKIMKNKDLMAIKPLYGWKDDTQKS